MISKTPPRATPDMLESEDREAQSVTTLLRRLTHELTTLFRQELALAVAELTQTLSRTLIGVGTAAAGGAVLFAGVLVLLAAAVLGLSHVMPAWAAALVVGAIISVIGIAAVLAGKRALPASFRPTRTTRSLSKDKDVLTRK